MGIVKFLNSKIMTDTNVKGTDLSPTKRDYLVNYGRIKNYLLGNKGGKDLPPHFEEFASLFGISELDIYNNSDADIRRVAEWFPYIVNQLGSLSPNWFMAKKFYYDELTSRSLVFVQADAFANYRKGKDAPLMLTHYFSAIAA